MADAIDDAIEIINSYNNLDKESLEDINKIKEIIATLDGYIIWTQKQDVINSYPTHKLSKLYALSIKTKDKFKIILERLQRTTKKTDSSTCPNCGKTNPPGSNNCLYCGSSLNEKMLPRGLTDQRIINANLSLISSAIIDGDFSKAREKISLFENLVNSYKEQLGAEYNYFINLLNGYKEELKQKEEQTKIIKKEEEQTKIIDEYFNRVMEQLTNLKSYANKPEYLTQVQQNLTQIENWLQTYNLGDKTKEVETKISEIKSILWKTAEEAQRLSEAEKRYEAARATPETTPQTETPKPATTTQPETQKPVPTDPSELKRVPSPLEPSQIRLSKEDEIALQQRIKEKIKSQMIKSDINIGGVRAVSEVAVGGGAMFCPNCGAKLEGDAEFCQNCGTKL